MKFEIDLYFCLSWYWTDFNVCYISGIIWTECQRYNDTDDLVLHFGVTELGVCLGGCR